MATVPGIKYDDGLPGYSANCFPVRGLLRQAEEGKAKLAVFSYKSVRNVRTRLTMPRISDLSMIDLTIPGYLGPPANSDTATNLTFAHSVSSVNVL